MSAFYLYLYFFFKVMKKLLVIKLLILSGLAEADQLIFSQFDGVNTWNNIYLEVEDASIYDGAFIDGLPGETWDSSISIKRTEGKEAVIETTTTTTITRRETRVYNHNTEIGRTIKFTKNADGNWRREGRWTNYEWYHKKCHKGMGCKDRTYSHTLEELSETITETTIIEEAVEGTEEVTGKSGGHEDPQIRRTIVSVPTEANMSKYIEEYLH